MKWYRCCSLVGLVLLAAGCRSTTKTSWLPAPGAAAAPTMVEVAGHSQIAPAQPLESGLNSAAPARPATAAAANSNGWVSLAGWGHGMGLQGPTIIASNSPVTYAMRQTGLELAVTAGSRLARVNGLAFFLGFAPQVAGGLPQLHTLDIDKNLQALLTPPRRFAQSTGVIVLDPGHGGRDPGTADSSGHRLEKDFTLDWALRLRPLLEERGWKVILTRETDTDVSLGDRVLAAEKARADLFISLHFNSAPANPAMQGIETYCLTPSGMPSTLVRYEEDDAAQSWPNNAHDGANFQLALQVHRELLGRTGAEDRGVRRARFMTVLRGQTRPAILIEGGYLSHAAESRRIHSPAYRQKLAEAVARALR